MQIARADSPDTVEPLDLDESDLVWASDRDTLFGNYAAENHNTEPALRGGKELTTNISRDEHFMAWMRLSAHPSAYLPVWLPCICQMWLHHLQALRHGVQFANSPCTSLQVHLTTAPSQTSCAE
jgi:hypothetical protein